MKQVVLASHPQGDPKAEDFAVVDAPVPEPGEGQMLVRTKFLALDPLIRFSLDEKILTGVAKSAIGEPVFGSCVSEVVESRHPDFAPGDVVVARTGWREFGIADPKSYMFSRVDPSLAPISTALGVLGMPGQTAHACMIGIGRVQAGETVVISAAAGTVGSTAGQIGRILGARVVGIAGGPEKGRVLVDELGFDACVDYRAPDYAEQLKAACPDGIDCYVENVGGPVMDPVLPLMKRGARMPVCGFIAYYGVGMTGPGPDRMPGFLRMVMTKGLEIRGFGGTMVAGEAALKELAGWVREGRIKTPETVVEGLENAPAAFAGVFGRNDNVGRLLVKVGE